MITVQCINPNTLWIYGKGSCVATVNGEHDLKPGEELPFKSLTVDGDKIRVEVERPQSLVEAVGAYHKFNNRVPCKDNIERAMYDAWLREKKEKTR